MIPSDCFIRFVWIFLLLLDTKSWAVWVSSLLFLFKKFVFAEVTPRVTKKTSTAFEVSLLFFLFFYFNFLFFIHQSLPQFFILYFLLKSTFL